MSSGKGTEKAQLSRSRRILRRCIEVGLVLLVGLLFHLGEDFFKEARPEVEASVSELRTQTRNGIAELAPLNIGWNFLKTLTHRMCSCREHDMLDCEWDRSLTSRMCSGPVTEVSLLSPKSWLFRIMNASMATYFLVKDQSWLSIVLFVIALVIAFIVCWDIEPWLLVLPAAILVASGIAMVLWLLAWLFSVVALAVIALLALVLALGGARVAEHYIIHPLEERLARLLRLEGAAPGGAAHDDAAHGDAAKGDDHAE